MNLLRWIVKEIRFAKEALTPPAFVQPTQSQKDAGVHWQDLNRPDQRSKHKDS